jgi:hypothetical protein
VVAWRAAAAPSAGVAVPEPVKDRGALLRVVLLRSLLAGRAQLPSLAATGFFAIGGPWIVSERGAQPAENAASRAPAAEPEAAAAAAA